MMTEQKYCFVNQSTTQSAFEGLSSRPQSVTTGAWSSLVKLEQCLFKDTLAVSHPNTAGRLEAGTSQV